MNTLSKVTCTTSRQETLEVNYFTQNNKTQPEKIEEDEKDLKIEEDEKNLKFEKQK